MKRMSISVSIAIALFATSAALAAVSLHRTYNTTITISAAGGQLKGVWTIKFAHPNYTVADNGTVVLRGKYVIKGSTIAFRDKHGPAACPGAGKYTLSLTGKTLTFTRNQRPDFCLPGAQDRARRHLLDGGLNTGPDGCSRIPAHAAGRRSGCSSGVGRVTRR